MFPVILIFPLSKLNQSAIPSIPARTAGRVKKRMIHISVSVAMDSQGIVVKVTVNNVEKWTMCAFFFRHTRFDESMMTTHVSITFPKYINPQ